MLVNRAWIYFIWLHFFGIWWSSFLNSGNTLSFGIIRWRFLFVWWEFANFEGVSLFLIFCIYGITIRTSLLNLLCWDLLNCVSGDIPAATAEDVNIAVEAAQRALSRNRGKDWSSASGAHRAKYLRAIAAKVHFEIQCHSWSGLEVEELIPLGLICLFQTSLNYLQIWCLLVIELHCSLRLRCI